MMVDPVCPHCQNTGFEVRAETVAGAARKLLFVRCSACGAAISLLPTAERTQEQDPGDAIREIHQLVTRMSKRLTEIEYRLNEIDPHSVH